MRVQLLSHEPPFPLPPKSRRQAGTGWVMIDAGQFAVHVLSKDAREKYFNDQTEW
jgi:ribosomal silencing factor RsfS